MRAFFVATLNTNASEITLTDDAFNHIKVVRLKEREEIILLDGKGNVASARLASLQKRSATLDILERKHVEQTSRFDIAVGLVKKDAFDLCLKMAVELGVRRIYPVLSKFSQRYDINQERAARLLQQALEQSNGAWLPELMPACEIDSIVDISKNYQHVVVMGMQESRSPAQIDTLNGDSLGVVGPEGGFDIDEENKLKSLNNSLSIHLPCPILRAPTALSALGGVIFTKQALLD